MKKNRAQGFTIIELVISMVFLSILIMSIAALVTQLLNMYSKGMALRAMNEASATTKRELEGRFAELESIHNSPGAGGSVTTPGSSGVIFMPFTTEFGDHYSFVSDVDKDTGKQNYGCFFVDRYMYCWNTLYGLQAYGKNEEELSSLASEFTSQVYGGVLAPSANGLRHFLDEKGIKGIFTYDMNLDLSSGQLSLKIYMPSGIIRVGKSSLGVNFVADVADVDYMNLFGQNNSIGILNFNVIPVTHTQSGELSLFTVTYTLSTFDANFEANDESERCVATSLSSSNFSPHRCASREYSYNIASGLGINRRSY